MKKSYVMLSVLSALAPSVLRGASLLNVSYNAEDEIPSEYAALYSEKDGKWVLTGIAGIKTSEDVARLQESLRKEREDHKATKMKLQAFDGMDAEELQTKLDRIAELEAAAGGKLDEGKINEMVEARLRSRTAPLERKITQLEQDLGTKDTEIKTFVQKEQTRTIHDHIRKAAKKANLLDSAIEDALVLGERVLTVNENNEVVTRDNVGTTPGVLPEVWLTELQSTRPHWWPESVGAGANGGKGLKIGSNPFTAENWNMTEQGRIVRENPTKAAQLAKLAGTTIGGPKPALKKA